MAAAVIAASAVTGCDSRGPEKLSASNFRIESESRDFGSTIAEEYKATTVSPLADGPSALAAWRETIRGARRTIDLKTFIFRPDDTGLLIAQDLIDAANRGVRVRVLVDDLFHHFKKNDIGFLGVHQNIELRIFNPLNRMLPGPISFIAEYDKVNPRMHGKALIVDGHMAIVGGRNIASEYFRKNRREYFMDFELLVSGQCVSELVRSFNEYWNDDYAVPHRKLPRRKSAKPALSEKTSAAGEAVTRRADVLSAPIALRTTPPPVFAAESRVSFDPASKTRARPGNREYVVGETVFRAVARAEKSVLIVTPYFIPEKYGTHLLTSLSRRGIKVTVLTNSLASTNHASAHAGYLRYRSRLLRAGVTIYEYRSNIRHQYSEGGENFSPVTSLHGKVILIDDQTVIVGSLNLDPRSVRTNSELVLVSKGSGLATWVRGRFEKLMGEQSYSVSLGPDGKTSWKYKADEKDVVRNSEPTGSASHGFVAALFALLPLDSAL